MPSPAANAPIPEAPLHVLVLDDDPLLLDVMREMLAVCGVSNIALEAGSTLYHSLIVHFENDVPIQFEDRWVNPTCAPAYLEQDFSSITPNEHLMVSAPLQGATYTIEALPASGDTARHLGIAPGAPCLVLHRRTTSAGRIASVATMWHPGHLTRFTGSV